MNTPDFPDPLDYFKEILAAGEKRVRRRIELAAQEALAQASRRFTARAYQRNMFHLDLRGPQHSMTSN